MIPVWPGDLKAGFTFLFTHRHPQTDQRGPIASSFQQALHTAYNKARLVDQIEKNVKHGDTKHSISSGYIWRGVYVHPRVPGGKRVRGGQLCTIQVYFWTSYPRPLSFGIVSIL